MPWGCPVSVAGESPAWPCFCSTCTRTEIKPLFSFTPHAPAVLAQPDDKSRACFFTPRVSHVEGTEGRSDCD